MSAPPPNWRKLTSRGILPDPALYAARQVSRRRIRLVNRSATLATGWLEDENHHFRLTIRHRDGVIERVRGTSKRYPWRTCIDAPAALAALEGTALVKRASDLGGVLDMRPQCTHLFELAALTSAHAANGRADTDYHAVVRTAYVAEQSQDEAVSHAVLLVNAAPALDWRICRATILSPAEHASVALFTDFRHWLDRQDAVLADAAFVLRRAYWLHTGRGVDLDRFTTASDIGVAPVCYTFQPERLPAATRMHGSARRFGDAEAMPERGDDDR